MSKIIHYIPSFLALALLAAGWMHQWRTLHWTSDSDNIRRYGYPSVFYEGSGHCTRPPCNHSHKMHYMALLVDLAMLIGFPFAVQNLCNAIAGGIKKLHRTMDGRSLAPFCAAFALVVLGWLHAIIFTVRHGFPMTYYAGGVYCAFPCLDAHYTDFSSFWFDVIFAMAFPLLVQVTWPFIRTNVKRLLVSQRRYIPLSLAVLATIAGWCYMTISTLDAPASDGVTLYGFPLPFYAFGGFCAGPCNHLVNTPLLLADIAFAILFPFAVHKLWNRRRKPMDDKP